MKRVKKLSAVLLSLAMMVAFTLPALAQAGDYSITITPTTKNHTYTAYQIFSGDLSGGTETPGSSGSYTGYVLTNIQWGSGVTNTSGLLQALQNIPAFATLTSASTAADVAALLNSATNLEDFLNVLNSTPGYLSGTTAGTAAPGEGETTCTIDLNQAGYYLVKDTLTGDGENELVSDYIVQVLGQESMAPKGDVSQIEKKVKDIDDSANIAGAYTGWQDSADHDIGDAVPFQITATVGDDYDNYDEYTFVIHDEQSPGLTFDDTTVTVKVDGTKIETGYRVVTEGLGDNCTFHVVFDDLKDIASVRAGSAITVEYTSTLNTNAVIGAQGNPNETYLEYSNNPNGTGTGKTPKDTVIVFTYKVDVNKVDQNQQPLEGAQFTLEKWIADTEGGTTGHWTAPETVTASGTGNNVFSFTGLDDGKYRLIETVTPSGYNTIAPIVFTVTADHVTDLGTAAAYGAPSATGNYVDANDDPITGAIAITFAAIDGGVSTTVVNESGTLLPETGGMGTTIFYALGGLLVLGAGILLVVRFRMREADNRQ